MGRKQRCHFLCDLPENSRRGIQKLAERSKPSYTDKNVSSGKTYTYKIVAKNEQKEADEAAKVTFSNTKAVQIRSQKYTYSQMKKDMQELEQKYSNYCEMTKIGTVCAGACHL